MKTTKLYLTHVCEIFFPRLLSSVLDGIPEVVKASFTAAALGLLTGWLAVALYSIAER